MKLGDGDPFFIYLVKHASEAELQAVRQAQVPLCPQHLDSMVYAPRTGFFAGRQACVACVQRSRALSEVGRSGGKIGGKKKTEKKMAAFRENAAQRWPGDTVVVEDEVADLEVKNIG